MFLSLFFFLYVCDTVCVFLLAFARDSIYCLIIDWLFPWKVFWILRFHFDYYSISFYLFVIYYFCLSLFSSIWSFAAFPHVIKFVVHLFFFSFIRGFLFIVDFVEELREDFVNVLVICCRLFHRYSCVSHRIYRILFSVRVQKNDKSKTFLLLFWYYFLEER